MIEEEADLVDQSKAIIAVFKWEERVSNDEVNSLGTNGAVIIITSDPSIVIDSSFSPE